MAIEVWKRPLSQMEKALVIEGLQAGESLKDLAEMVDASINTISKYNAKIEDKELRKTMKYRKNFMAKISKEITEFGECWIWHAYSNPKTGQCKFQYNYKSMHAKTIAKILFPEEIREHNCGNPLCVAPSEYRY